MRASRHGASTSAIRARGHFSAKQTTLKYLYLAGTGLAPKGRRRRIDGLRPSLMDKRTMTP